MRHAPRLPYCGTCKTIGVRYGQRARLLLNHDLVFLGELLMHYSSTPEWTPAYRSFNCFAKPKEIFPILDYTAAITVILAHYRIADHRDDSGGWHWRAAARMLSPQFRKASARLRESGFPMDELDALLKTQTAREANPKSLADVAEPTAAATAMAFAHGGAHPDLHRIGYRFGYLIYLLDAFEDRPKDARSGAFNALERFPEIDGRAEILKTVVELRLPAPFQQRLRINVEERLGMRPRVLGCISRRTLGGRYRDALNFARNMRERDRLGVAVFTAVVAVAILFPHHARGSISWRECLSVPFNLMALSAFLAAPAGTPAAKKGGGGCSNSCGTCCCSDGCCDCCDGCGDCCGSCDC